MQEVFRQQRDRAKSWCESLRDSICRSLEDLETEAPIQLFGGAPKTFEFKEHHRANGSGKGIGGFLRGRLFEKAGVHTSTTEGLLPPELAATMPGADNDPAYTSTSISVIIHPRSPRVPTVHMNTRYFATTQYWFGGGTDLSPMICDQRSQSAADAIAFHASLKQACDAFDPSWYDRYKKWCDEYFVVPHRQQPRGVGGIFFDHHNSGNFERDFDFAQAAGDAFLDAYVRIVRRRMQEPWTSQERREQLATRSLYVEFNLLYDRGTMFGLKVGGNVDTILSSMPPHSTWT